jgi:hypothetical protein
LKEGAKSGRRLFEQSDSFETIRRAFPHRISLMVFSVKNNALLANPSANRAAFRIESNW